MRTDLTNTPPEWIAPEGAIWVCGACGRNGRIRDTIGDESCFLNAILCVDDKPDLVPTTAHEWTAWKASDLKARGER